MKILNIDYERYQYPNGMTSISDFIKLANQLAGQFISMQRYDEGNCVFPYLIWDESNIVYLNISTIAKIYEEEVFLLSREEYDAKLAICVSEKCLDCLNYAEDKDGDNLEGHRNKLCLDGTCHYYKKGTNE